ncbi:MAG: hypothetical protein ACOYT4_01080 [Nanoarchaeota archaeon]
MENREVIQWNIKQSKQILKKEILKDETIIFSIRIIEDLENEKFILYDRIKDFVKLIFPYSTFNKKSLREIKEFKSEYGLELDEQEINFLRLMLSLLDEEFKPKNLLSFKGEICKFLNLLLQKYFPNSYKSIDAINLAKIISSAGGIKNLYARPSSTIQLIGAEKALFRHISENKPCPKYGLIYRSSIIQKSKNKGKEARRLANKLSLDLRKDYFQKFCPMMRIAMC